MISKVIDILETKTNYSELKAILKIRKKGEIEDFTGVQDPFEEPKDPEVIVNTQNESIEQSMQKIIKYLKN